MRTAIIAGAAAAALAATPLAALPLESVFTSYYAFGDSLTDDGKFGALFPPSFGGRFTNGVTYSEIIAERFAVSANYALGGATAGPENETAYPPGFGPLFGTLENQLSTFQATGGPALAGSNPLVLIFLGSNDIFQNYDEPDFIVTDAADAVIDAVEQIAALGPFDDFILPLLPGATGASPFVPFRNAFNEHLLDRAAELEAEGLRIWTPSVDPATARVASNPDVYGVTNLGSCATTVLSLTLADNCTFTGFEDGVPQFDLSLADAYMLIDGVHPTAPVHREWAADIIATVERDLTAVPVPGAGLLLAFGLAAFGAARRARA